MDQPTKLPKTWKTMKQTFLNRILICILLIILNIPSKCQTIDSVHVYDYYELKIMDTNEFSKIQAISINDIPSNCFSKISFRNFNNLTYLGIERCNLKGALGWLSYCDKLVSLDLSSNKLKKCPDFSKNKELKLLCLSNTDLNAFSIF